MVDGRNKAAEVDLIPIAAAFVDVAYQLRRLFTARQPLAGAAAPY